MFRFYISDPAQFIAEDRIPKLKVTLVFFCIWLELLKIEVLCFHRLIKPLYAKTHGFVAVTMKTPPGNQLISCSDRFGKRAMQSRKGRSLPQQARLIAQQNIEQHGERQFRASKGKNPTVDVAETSGNEHRLQFSPDKPISALRGLS